MRGLATDAASRHVLRRVPRLRLSTVSRWCHLRFCTALAAAGPNLNVSHPGQQISRPCHARRPEIKFGGLPQLMDRIRTDIGIAKAQLADPALAAGKEDAWFSSDGLRRTA